ncbi:GMC family oxidoreductase [Neogemmobacter tilapiae]|uniref:Sorbose dehydrogenase n=1 Tax=Neogemmobacter tilapiae TaxID=875041 RepID=A0A918WJ03_9RHOB|nr:GMC family oxidoreductase N-terminal domain-containing protein [Gemmobacter tilapiae]GHC50899.1 sorbose dehydrogenase [Gemmobacter tilapiae]
MSDFIIIGGGSSGCLIASRLVQSGASVLLLEEGPARGHPLLDLPAGYMKFLNSERFLKYYPTTPQPQLGGRSMIIPQGRILGGGSAINAMVYLRGTAQDYDDWAQITGDQGWSYQAMLPHFTAMEGNAELSGPHHGTQGPLKVSHLGHMNPVTAAFLAACDAIGLHHNDDFNGPTQAGSGRMQHTIDGHARRRSSAVKAFLAPIKTHKNLRLECGARVDQLLMTGDRVTGVRWQQNGQTHESHAAQIMLTAGALASPHLLMRSGLGPETQLRAAGIAVRADLPQVGQNLQDHCEVPVISTLRRGMGYFGQDSGWNMLRHGLRYVLSRSGPVTSTGVEACAFISLGTDPRPMIQLYCVPTVYVDRTVSGVDPTWGLTLTPCLARPKSRGEIRLNPADPHGLPLVDPAFLTNPADMQAMRDGIAKAREVLAQAPLRDMVTGALMPTDFASDSIDRHIRATVKTNYHPVGTCAMGSVVDSHLRVMGVQGLRIADASIMPQIPAANTNAPTLALASRAAELILAP